MSGTGSDGNGNGNHNGHPLGSLGSLFNNGATAPAQPALTDAPPLPKNHPLVDKMLALLRRNGQTMPTPLMIMAFNEQVVAASDDERHRLDVNLDAGLAAPIPPPVVLQQAAQQAAFAEAQIAHAIAAQSPVVAPIPTQAPVAAPAAATTVALETPAAAAAPVTGPPQDVIPFPRTPGLVPVGAPMYRVTQESIKASAFVAIVNGQRELRYRMITGGLTMRRGGGDTNQELVFLIKLTQPALLSDHTGRVVEVPPGTVGVAQLQGVHGNQSLTVLAQFIDKVNRQYPFVEVEPTGFVHGLDGKEEAVFDIRTLPGDKPTAEGTPTIKRISGEALGFGAPPAATNGAGATV